MGRASGDGPRPARHRKGPGLSPLHLLFLLGALCFAGSLIVITTLSSSTLGRSLSITEVAQQRRSVGVPPPPPPSPAPREVHPGYSGRVVWWHAPFFSGGGMGMEALQLVMGLQQHTEWRNRVWMTSHGDLDEVEVFDGLPPEVQRQAARMVRAGEAASPADARQAIIVCHSEPGAWALPTPLYQTRPCPPTPGPAFVVGRAMFETDRLTSLHVHRINQMDAVWVPTEFHRTTFTASGVDPAKLAVVPEPVDGQEFDPARHRPLELPLGRRVFGPRWPHGTAGGAHGGARVAEPFVFLSVFKWEARKGWDVLLRAFLSTFTAADNVLLLLSTKPFHSEANFAQQMEAWVRRELSGAAAGLDGLPSVYVLDRHIPQRAFPRLFAAADCFVLPTRGEGWGLPIAEAMTMGLPAIATNWSGPTAFLDEAVGYPLRVEALVEVEEGAFKGHRWAQPSAEHLSQLLRHVATHRDEAAARGRAARAQMTASFSPSIVAEVVSQQLRRIDAALVAASASQFR